eukprot:1301174-Prymnesium_polylepis.1
MWPELRAVCAAYGITLKEVTPPPSFMALALEIENGTSDFYEEAPEPYTPEQRPAPRPWARCRCHCGCFTLCAPG